MLLPQYPGTKPPSLFAGPLDCHHTKFELIFHVGIVSQNAFESDFPAFLEFVFGILELDNSGFLPIDLLDLNPSPETIECDRLEDV